MDTQTTQLKIFFSASSINIFLDTKDEKKIISALTSDKPQWTPIKQKSGNTITIKNSEIVAIEKMEAKVFASEGTIAIKTLAQFAGVHPVTLTRLFPDTLKQIGKGRRATPETAKLLHGHLLLKKKSNARPLQDFLDLF